jgi:formylmethanofuran dehydrogenase subunit E
MQSVDDLLEQYELIHGSLSPCVVLAIRMTLSGCQLVGIEDPRGADQKKLIVWAEVDRWLVDALEIATGVRLGKRTLRFLDYGKLAATFLNKQTGRAVRLVARESARRLADERYHQIESARTRQMNFYRIASLEELFAFELVKMRLNKLHGPDYSRSRVICARCGEGVSDGREVNALDGIKLCRPCAFGEDQWEVLTSDWSEAWREGGRFPSEKNDALVH